MHNPAHTLPRVLMPALIGLGATAALAGNYGINEAAGVPEGYQQVWADEFDKAGLPDAKKWGYDTHANAKGWYNNELQYYARARSKNSRVEGGVLILEAHAESAAAFADSKSGAPQAYTSARLVTQGQASWLYGYVEARIKVPCGKGIWPAFWGLADVPNLQWPLDGEIDLMEHINTAGEVHFSTHTQAHNHAQQTQATVTHSAQVCDDQFHTYQMLWTADEIKLGLDGRHLFSYKNEGKGKSQWPFNTPQYLLLNIAVGGDWPGSPSASTVFPARMEVDYVRVYQKKP